MYIPLLVLFILLLYSQKIYKYYMGEKLGWIATERSYYRIIYKEKINGS